MPEFTVWIPITANINMVVEATNEAEAREKAIEVWAQHDLDDVDYSEGDDVRIEEKS